MWCFVMPTTEKCEVFLKVTGSVPQVEEIARNRKYIDGIAFDEENSDVIGKSLDIVRRVFTDGCKILLVGLGNVFGEILEKVDINQFEVLLAFNEPEELKTFKTEHGDLKDISVGIYLTKPVTSPTQYARLGAEFILIPPALIRGRLIREARARKIRIIAYQVNDIATYVKLVESGVDGVVTTVPTIKRDARKLIKT